MTPISKLHPADESAAAIATALDRIAAERDQAEAAIAAAAELHERLMTEGEPKQVREAETELADARTRLAQIGALEAKLRPALDQAREQERRSGQDQRHAAALAAMAEDAARWNRELPPLTSAIRGLIGQRKGVIEQLRAASAACDRRPDLPNLWGHIDRLTQSTSGPLPITDTEREAAWHAATAAHEKRRRIERENEAATMAAMDQRMRAEEEARRDRIIVHRVAENSVGFEVGRIDPAFIRR